MLESPVVAYPRAMQVLRLTWLDDELVVRLSYLKTSNYLSKQWERSR